MIALMMSLLVGDCGTCPQGTVCINSVCTQPQNQAIAACACRCGEAPTCDQSGDLPGTAATAGGAWGNCSCDKGFQPSLRLVFRWEPADNLSYKVPDPASTDPSQMLAIATSGLSDAQVRGTIHDAFNNWSPSACPGGGAPVLHINNPAAAGIPTFETANTQNEVSFDANGFPVSPGPHDLENRVWVNNSLGPCDRPCFGTVVAGGDASCSDGASCEYGDAILAYTPITYSSTSTDVLSRIYRARTVVNGKSFNFRSTTGGCTHTPGANDNCFDLLNTLTHEFGHFFGYMHTSCATSIMYGAASTDTATDGVLGSDLASLCGEGNCTTLGYGNNVVDTSVAQWVDKTGTTIAIDTTGSPKPRLASCTTNADCGPTTGRMICVGAGQVYPAGAGGTAVGGSGFCTISCSSADAGASTTPSLDPLTKDADCPAGEACVTITNGAAGTQEYCAVSAFVAACIPQAFNDPTCTGDTSSSSGDGSTDSGGTTGTTGGGTTGLTGSSDDPSSGGAFTDFCAPCTQHSDCNTGDCVDLGNGQSICTGPCSSDVDCPSGSTCSGQGEDGGFCYPTDTSCITTAAAARRQLNESCDQQSLCSPGLLCVQLNNDSVCLEYCEPNGADSCSTDGYACVRINNTDDVGVCFKSTAHQGDSCALPDNSLCGLEGNLICAGTAADNYVDAKCYALCDSGGTYGACTGSSQTCVDFPNSTTGVCTPVTVSQCLSDLGQQCTTADDCSSGVCHTQGTLSGCTRSCDLSTLSGCPANFTCEDVQAGDGKGLCWPTSNTITKPTCPATSTGCGCHQGGGFESLVTALAVACILWGRRKRWSKR